MSQITWENFLKEINRTENDAKDWSLETLKNVCKDTSFKDNALALADIESHWKKLQGPLNNFFFYILNNFFFYILSMIYYTPTFLTSFRVN